MKKVILLSAAAVVMTAAGAFAQGGATAPKVTKRVTQPMMPYIVQMRCEVNGTPSEFPNDLVFFNRSTTALPAGKKIAWETTGPIYKGTYVLPTELKGGAAVRASNVLPNGIEAGKPCKASPK